MNSNAQNTRRAVLLLSGGLDSATAGAIVRADGFALLALSFRYGQRHARELECARIQARALGCLEHREIPLELGVLGGSALTDPTTPVPKDRDVRAMDAGSIPSTYVPARNTLFLAYALAFAEVRGVFDLVLGVNAVDYSGYPDCRPAFLRAFTLLANRATRAGVESRARGEPGFRIHAPLLTLTKGEIVRRGLALGVDYSATHSCYDPAPDGRACGRCDSCRLRLAGFATAGAVDPLPYASE